MPSPDDRVYTVRWIRSRKCLASDPLTRWRWSEPSQAEKMTLKDAEHAAARMGGVVCVDGVPVDNLGAPAPQRPKPVTPATERVPLRDRIRAELDAGRALAALRLGTKIRQASADDRRTLERAVEALRSPGFCVQLGRDPEATIRAGLAVLERLVA